MKIELMGKKIEAGSREQEEMKVGRVTLSESEIKGIAALAGEAYWALHDELCDFDKVDEFRTYVAIVSLIAATNPPLAMDLISNLLKDKECDGVLAKIFAFIPREENHIAYFVNHFGAMLIHEMIEEEEEDEWDEDCDDDEEYPDAEIIIEEFVPHRN